MTTAPAPATTVDYLEQHAFAQPGKVALSVDGQAFSYQRFFRDVMRVTAALQAQGLGVPGSTAAVGHDDLYQHWLLLLACENLGVATASFSQTEWQALPELIGAVDSVLVDMPPAVPVPTTRALDSAWFDQALRMPWHDTACVQRTRSPLQAPQRISRSSGTTHAPKLMLLSRLSFEQLVQRQIDSQALNAEAVLYQGTPLAVNTVYAAACACLRLGATVVRGALLPTLLSQRVTHLRCLTGTLVNLLQQWPVDAPQLAALRIGTGGGPLPPALRARALATLCGEVTNGYGANEVGGVCLLDDDATGIVAAGVDLRIVDDDDCSLPIGAVGHIAIRSPGMVDGYWRDAGLTARHFRGGWFYPGDTGRLLSPRRLALLGRSDDMLNLGGIKHSPTAIENTFLAHPLVEAAAVTAVTEADGKEALLVALVLSDPSALTDVGRAVQQTLPSWAQRLRLLGLATLPTTPNGKVQRQALKSMHAALKSR
jgi:acyl-CoA synthetase (AMP-forming)/AMP-acid ligase II